MKTKALLAIAGIVASAGVVAYDPTAVMGCIVPKQPIVRPELAPDGSPLPALAARPGGSALPLHAPTADPATSAPPTDEAATEVTSAPVAEAPIAAPTAQPTAAPAPAEDPLVALFQQLAKQRAESERTPQPEAAREPSREVEDDSGGDDLAAFELRGILTGGSGSLVVISGELLRVGDELPGGRWRLAEVKRDRVQIAPARGNGAARTLRLRSFTPAAKQGDGTTPQPAADGDANSPAAAPSADPTSSNQGAASSAAVTGGKQ